MAGGSSSKYIALSSTAIVDGTLNFSSLVWKVTETEGLGKGRD
jgi:hypothetical protein